MVRCCGRSRGCKTCRQRKVKCDEKRPECTQCVSHGQICPGPIVGAVFVNMKPKTQTPAENRGFSFQNASNTSNTDTRISQSRRSGITRRPSLDDCLDDRISVNQLPASLESQIRRPSHQLTDIYECNIPSGAGIHASRILPNFRIPPSPPSRAKAFEQLYLSHYIESFGNFRGELAFCFDRLPELLASTVLAPVKLSIRAVVMVFYGILTGNIAMQTEARSWYARAVRCLCSFLQDRTLIGDAQTALPNGDVLCAPIMMSQFEIMASTSPVVWIQHLEAATTMLLSRRPKNCSLGLEHEMFLAVRLFMLFVSVTTNRPHPFASQPWLTIPFEKRTKSPIDELVDILLSLPGCLALGEKIANHGNEESSGIERRLRNYALGIISQLDSWCQRCCAEIVEPDGRKRTFLEHSAETRVGMSALKFDSPEKRSYSDVYTAVFSAMYDAANLIAFSLLLLISLPTDHPPKHRIQFHTQSILSADAFIESNGYSAPAGGSLLMVFPLKIVGLWGPLQEQRDDAFRKLQTWDREGESHSICKFSASTFVANSRNHEGRLY